MKLSFEHCPYCNTQLSDLGVREVDLGTKNKPHVIAYRILRCQAKNCWWGYEKEAPLNEEPMYGDCYADAAWRTSAGEWQALIKEPRNGTAIWSKLDGYKVPSAALDAARTHLKKLRSFEEGPYYGIHVPEGLRWRAVVRNKDRADVWTGISYDSAKKAIKAARAQAKKMNEEAKRNRYRAPQALFPHARGSLDGTWQAVVKDCDNVIVWIDGPCVNSATALGAAKRYIQERNNLEGNPCAEDEYDHHAPYHPAWDDTWLEQRPIDPEQDQQEEKEEMPQVDREAAIAKVHEKILNLLRETEGVTVVVEESGTGRQSLSVDFYLDDDELLGAPIGLSVTTQSGRDIEDSMRAWLNELDNRGGVREQLAEYRAPDGQDVDD